MTTRQRLARLIERTVYAIAIGSVMWLLAIATTSCALLTKGSTIEQKSNDIRNLAFAAASLGTREALLQNPTWRPRFVAAYEKLNQLVEQKIVTGTLLREVLESLPVRELKSDKARIALDTFVFVFDVTVGRKIDLDKAPYVTAGAVGIRDGLKSGLGL